jgi:hypothetical protein
MSSVKYRSATEQCREYVEDKRALERRTRANAVLRASLALMRQEFGATLTLSTLIRYVGQCLVEGTNRACVSQCCRYLAKCIAVSVMKGLTRRAIRH